MSNISMVAPSRSFEIKPVSPLNSDFTTKKRIFTTIWFQNCKNCKVLLPWSRSIWKEYLWFFPLCDRSYIFNLVNQEAQMDYRTTITRWDYGRYARSNRHAWVSGNIGKSFQGFLGLFREDSFCFFHKFSCWFAVNFINFLNGIPSLIFFDLVKERYC